MSDLVQVGTKVEALSAALSDGRRIVHWRGEVIDYSADRSTYLILTPSGRLVEWSIYDTHRYTPSTTRAE